MMALSHMHVWPLTIPAPLLRSVRRFTKENNERLRLSGFLIITLC